MQNDKPVMEWGHFTSLLGLRASKIAFPVSLRLDIFFKDTTTYPFWRPRLAVDQTSNDKFFFSSGIGTRLWTKLHDKLKYVDFTNLIKER